MEDPVFPGSSSTDVSPSRLRLIDIARGGDVKQGDSSLDGEVDGDESQGRLLNVVTTGADSQSSPDLPNEERVV